MNNSQFYINAARYVFNDELTEKLHSINTIYSLNHISILALKFNT